MPAAAIPGHVHSTSALEMTKWFDTNHHYMVPPSWRWIRNSCWPPPSRSIISEAKALGIHTRPSLRPVTFLRLAKSGGEDRSARCLLLAVYTDLLNCLYAAGADWVQIDEPCLVLDLEAGERCVFTNHFAAEVPKLNLMFATYFGALGDNSTSPLRFPCRDFMSICPRAGAD